MAVVRIVYVMSLPIYVLFIKVIQIPPTAHNLFKILPKVVSIFASESAVIHTDATSILIVADLHGDMDALQFPLHKESDLGCDSVIFLGDYIDRGPGMRTFGEDVFDEFLQVNGLEMMVRGHSAVEGGFKWWFGERLLSLFTAMGYDEGRNVEVVKGR